MEKLVRLSNEEVQSRYGSIDADEVWVNDLYRVAVKKAAGEFAGQSLVHLTIKRNDNTAIHSWGDFQAIKNQLVDKNCEGVELYPAESRLNDQLHRYHLWVVSNRGFRFPFGFRDPGTWDEKEQGEMNDNQED